MKNIKLSTKGFAMVFAFVAFIAMCAGFLGYTAMDTNKQLNVQATVGTVNVTFSGFPSTTEAFCVVSFYYNNGSVYKNVVTTNSSFTLPTYTGVGKLEITVPMYANITSNLPTNTPPNGSTYYMDVDANTALTAITVTYNDSGYFGSSVVI